MNRIGRRTLILMAFWGIVGIIAISIGRLSGNDGAKLLPLTSAAAAQEARPDPSSKQPGRYQIFMHPTFRSDQYLIDTTTGQIWQLTKFSSLKGEPEAWKYMTRLDNESDYVAFLMSRPSSKPTAENSAPPSPAPARPKPQSPPMRLN
jgi:hypothetical protein